MFDISPTAKTVSRPWLHPPRKCPVVDLYDLSDTLLILSYTVTVSSGKTSLSVMDKYKDTTSRQTIYTNRPGGEGGKRNEGRGTEIAGGSHEGGNNILSRGRSSLLCGFLKTHIRYKGLGKLSGFKSPAPGASVSVLPQHTTYPEVQPTQIARRSAWDQTP